MQNSNENESVSPTSSNANWQAHGNVALHPFGIEGSQTESDPNGGDTTMKLDSTPKPEINARNNRYIDENGQPTNIASSSNLSLDQLGKIGSNGSSSNNSSTGNLSGNGMSNVESTKEAWKKRKQVLLAEARNQVPADLQLHGLRPPAPHSDAYHGLDQRPHVRPLEGALASLGDTSSPTLALSAIRASQQSAILRWQDGNIRDDMLRIIDQFLEEEGMGATRQILAEEWSGKVRERDESAGDARKLRKAILEGAWEEVNASKPLVKSSNAFKYAVFKQQYLEHIELREYQKAFTFLNKRLKELEHYQPFAGEFRDLCYLLSGKSISDAPSFRAWEGVRPAREALVAQFSDLLEQDRSEMSGQTSQAQFIPPHRLKTLVHQAVAYQVEFSRYHPKKAPRVSTLLYDYESFVCPNAIMSTCYGHQKNVKALAWVGQEGRSIASGSSDGTVRLWSTSSAQQEAVFEHGSRVWDVAATESGNLIASAGGHALVKLWNTSSRECVANLGGIASAGTGSSVVPPTGDVYSCAFDGYGAHLLTGGYDKIVRLYDLTSSTLVKTFTGHGLGVSSVTFDPAGRMAVTASKDCSVRLWDLNSGLCIRTVYGHLGECTSVELSESGREMLTASKDNSSMLHDLRTLKPLQRFKGAQNTRANFVRASFAHNSLIASGSEDGTVLLWDQESSECLQTLTGHGEGVVYCARWNRAQSLLASCGDDGTVRTWYWDEGGQERAESELEASGR
jgi:COMPASS component SWD3